MSETLISKTFGKLTVLSFVEKRNYRNWWLCKCSCGNIKEVREDRLLLKKTTSCGCALREPASNRLSLKGKRFGKLYVLDFESTEKNVTFWKCRCDCGNIIKASGKLLVRGSIKSCGCLKHKASYHRLDMKDKKFGILTVKGYAFTKKAVAYWYCECDCGNSVIISRNNLVSGNTKSCGCILHSPSKKRLNLIDKVFGKLKVISFSEVRNNHTYWKCLCSCGNERIVNSDALMQGYTRSCETCSNIPHFSEGEKEVAEYIKSIYKGEVVENDRSLIAPKELDIYIPEKQFAVEYNGLYWHSDKVQTSPSYHLQKTKSCMDKGIRLLHIYENEWRDKKDICKSMIASALGVYERKEYARNCLVRTIEDRKTVIDFFNENHIQGAVHKYTLCLGLYKGEELLQAVVFGKQHFGRNGDYELYRMVTKLNTQVLGGFSKLMKHSPYDTVVSYVALRMFDAKGYLAGNWKIENKATPSFCLTDGVNTYSRHLFKKSECMKKFDNVTEDMTEREMQIKNGFYRLWDCGTYRVRWSR